MGGGAPVQPATAIITSRAAGRRRNTHEAYGSRRYPDAPIPPGRAGMAGLRGGFDAGCYSGSITGGLLHHSTRQSLARRRMARWRGHEDTPKVT